MSTFDPIQSFANLRHEFGEHGGVNMSVEASTTFTVINPTTMPEIFQGNLGPDVGGCYLYGRHFNPTVYVLGRQIAAYEGAHAGYCTASGLSAIAATVMQLCDTGDHVVASRTVYGGTFALLHDYLPAKTAVTTSFVDVSDLAAVERAFTPRTRVLYCESVSNPTLRVADIPKLADIAHRHGAMLVVDNTFTPLIIAPIQHGADVVVHSLTKFMNGASDHIAGAVCGTTEFVMRLMDLHMGSLMLLGPTMDPQVAFDISLRLPHLGLRMAEHSRRASYIASRLDELGLPVIYPGLATHPDHGLLARLVHPDFGHGGILALDLGTRERAFEFMGLLQNEHQFGLMAVSLGFSETLMSCSAASTSSEMSEQDLEEAGIRPGLVRMSIGYTGALEQRWMQLRSVLEKMGPVR
ncbi:MAG: aminotransferase class I/II-fold pyridoxal phosphate-dependent enzyme [Steroidobacteraceae bacterium]|nr:aminotransferase class I/II-fold pyridoxal phosphate-dependent enzyme [Steroidobacteraceae bacterium]